MASMMASRSQSLATSSRRVASARSVVPKAISRRTVAVRAHCGDKPLVGGPAPDFKAQAVFDQEFVETTLSQYKGKYVVLFFYPLDFTFVCPTEITAFSDRHAEFKAINTEILGVSVDSQFTHLAWIQTDRKVRRAEGIRYRMNTTFCQHYGILIRIV